MTTKTSPKSGASKKTAAKPDISASALSGKTAEDKAQAEPANVVRRKEMVDRIVASSGLKPNAVKTVLDAVLAELGSALSAGESLNLHPLGKVTVNRQKKLDDREVLICKIRRKLGQADTSTALETAAQ